MTAEQRIRAAVAAAVKTMTKGERRAGQSGHMVPARGPHVVLTLDEVRLVRQDAHDHVRRLNPGNPGRLERLALIDKCDAALSSDDWFRSTD